jgi:lysophospholipase L1-like esterase
MARAGRFAGWRVRATVSIFVSDQPLGLAGSGSKHAGILASRLRVDMRARFPFTTRPARLAAVVISLSLCLCCGGAAATRRPLILPGVSLPSLVPGVNSSGVPVVNQIGAPAQVVFLGDSYTYGIGATQRSDGYAYLISEALHWDVDVIGLPGSGYTRVAKDDGLSIAAGIAPAIEAQPQVLIVECGHNDADPGISLAQTRHNALTDLRALRAGLPATTIVVLGPVWLNGRPTPRALAVRNAVHAAQKQIPGSLWIDPIGERWFTGRFVNRSGDDATMINYRVGHPNNLGYEHIAQVLEADLATLQIT